MLKRLLIVLLVTIFLGAMFSSDALAGPPWPAEVIHVRDGEMCNFPWVNSNYEIITLIGDRGTWVAQYHNGHIQWNCHTNIDFTNPELLSLDEVCALAPDFCKGNGSFQWPGIDCYADTYLTNDSVFVVTPSGNVTVSCHFDLNTP
jgi:hypothetical protein